MSELYTAMNRNYSRHTFTCPRCYLIFTPDYITRSFYMGRTQNGDKMVTDVSNIIEASCPNCEGNVTKDLGG